MGVDLNYMDTIKPKHAGGRPSTYTKELGEEICRRISLGESVRSICKEEGMPVISTIMKWLLDTDKKEFSEQYEQACNTRAEVLFEEILDIADDGSNDYKIKRVGDEVIEQVDSEHIQRSRLRVDTRKWYLSKVLPKKFGDKLDMTTNGKDLPIPILGGISNQNKS